MSDRSVPASEDDLVQPTPTTCLLDRLRLLDPSGNTYRRGEQEPDASPVKPLDSILYTLHGSRSPVGGPTAAG